MYGVVRGGWGDPTPYSMFPEKTKCIGCLRLFDFSSASQTPNEPIVDVTGA